MLLNYIEAFKSAIYARYTGALKGDPHTIVLVYQEIALINFLLMALVTPSPFARWVCSISAILALVLRQISGQWPLLIKTWAPLILIAVCITLNTWAYGGLHSIFMVWYLVIPVPVMLILGPRAMWWSLPLIGSMTALTYVLQRQGLLDAMPQPNSHMSTPLLTMLMMALSIQTIPMATYLVLEKTLMRHTKRNAELRETRDVLLEQQQQQDDFVASVSHELRTPMNAIMGFLQSVDTGQFKQARNIEVLKAMDHSARHLLTVINDLLDFSQIQKGSLRITPKPMSLHTLLRDVVTMFEAPLRERGIPLRLNLHQDLPDWIEADADRVTQVLINLMGNAAKFTQQGHIELEASFQAHRRIRLQVHDTGCGIAPEQLAAVFDRFSNLTDKTRRDYGGTGLGLSISENLVKLMGGDIGVVSTVNQGSTFWFDIPLVRVLTQAPASVAPPPLDLATLAPATILIVDDSAINRVVAHHMIRRDFPDVKVLEASSGLAALVLCRSEPVDVVLMDVVMPEIDGIETTRRLLTQGQSAPAVIGLTANVNPKVKASCLEAGMSHVLFKPYTRSDLTQTVAQVLRARFAARAIGGGHD